MTICQSTHEIVTKEAQVINNLIVDTFLELGELIESYDEIKDVYNRLIREGYTFEHETRDLGNLLTEHLLVTRLDGDLIYIIGAVDSNGRKNE